MVLARDVKGAGPLPKASHAQEIFLEVALLVLCWSSLEVNERSNDKPDALSSAGCAGP